jgi:hypothetical protein
LKTPLGAKLASHLLVTNNNLHRSGTITKIDKGNSTMVAATRNPSR